MPHSGKCSCPSSVQVILATLRSERPAILCSIASPQCCLMITHTCLGLASHYEKGVGERLLFGFSFSQHKANPQPHPVPLYMWVLLCQQPLDGLGLASYCEKEKARLLSALSPLLELEASPSPIQELFTKKHPFQRLLGGAVAFP